MSKRKDGQARGKYTLEFKLGVVVLILQIGALWVEKSLCDKDLRTRAFCARTVFVSH